MKKNRDISVDILRIIATYIVIGTHVKLSPIVDNVVQNDRLDVACIFADGVTIFFLITGFFLFNGRSYKDLIEKTIKKILIPAIIVSLLSQFIYEWMTSPYILQSLNWNNVRYNMVNWCKCLIQQNAGGAVACFHFWYLFTYVKIIIMMPLLKWVCNEGKEQKFARRILMILQFINIIELHVKCLKDIVINTYSFFDTAILIIMVGYELSVFKEKIKCNLCTRYMSIFIWMATMFARKYFQIKLYGTTGLTNEKYIYWDSPFGIVSAVCIFVFIYSFEWNLPNWTTLYIHKISNLTYGIYLIHVIIYFKCEAMGLKDGFYNKIIDCRWKTYIYSVIWPFFIFVGCLIVVYLFDRMKSKLSIMFNFIKGGMFSQE